MGPYRFSTLRRLIECEAQFLLSDHDSDTPELAFGRAGRQAIEQYLLMRSTGLISDSRGQEMMDAIAARVLLADAAQTSALREALRSLESWFPIPAPAPGEGTLLSEPVHVVLTSGLSGIGGRSITGSRIATQDEIAAGGVENGWLCQETLDYVYLRAKGQDAPDERPTTVIDWNFGRSLSMSQDYLRELEGQFRALLAWIRFGTLASRIRVVSVYPMLKLTKTRTYDLDDFVGIVHVVEGLLRRADEVLASGPATVKHARVGARCQTCTVSHMCPAVDGAVHAAWLDVGGWAVQAETWILLRRRVETLEASLREKTRADGPIATANGYEVGFRVAEFGVWSQRLADESSPIVEPT